MSATVQPQANTTDTAHPPAQTATRAGAHLREACRQLAGITDNPPTDVPEDLTASD